MQKILNIQLIVLSVGFIVSEIYAVKLTRFAKALGVFFIVCAILIAIICWWTVLFEIGFSISYVLSDYPLVERIGYLFIGVGFILSPPFAIAIGLHRHWATWNGQRTLGP